MHRISQLNRWERIETGKSSTVRVERLGISQLNRWERIETPRSALVFDFNLASPSLTAGSGLKHRSHSYYIKDIWHLPA